ncbi:MAG: radical SAM family heme chaperone HemW [Pseudomonadota bacterium]
MRFPAAQTTLTSTDIPLSVYVHLPWCERKCPYCDFNSHETRRVPEDAYIDALLTDLQSELRACPALEARSIESVFIGGGTPSLFSVAGIARLLDGLRACLRMEATREITMEANPGSTERERLAGFSAAGVTRFSMGIQSLNDRSLEALGRVHDRHDALRAMQAALASGADSVNVDLMHGLPGQSVADGLADLDTALAADPKHLSWYQLTIEPNTRFYSSPPPLPDEETLAELEERGAQRLIAAGYQRYEVSAWAKPGYECQHNLNYWRFGDYLGLGAGAHGKVTEPDRGVLRYRKTRQPEAYMAPRGTQRRDGRYLSSADLCGEFMLNALRLTDGFDIALFEERTGRSFDEVSATVSELVDRGLMENRDSTLRATALGRRFLDDLVSRFFECEPVAKDAVLASTQSPSR